MKLYRCVGGPSPAQNRKVATIQDPIVEMPCLDVSVELVRL